MSNEKKPAIFTLEKKNTDTPAEMPTVVNSESIVGNCITTRFNREEWLKIVIPAMISSPIHGKKGPEAIVRSAEQFIEALEKINLK